MRYFPSATHQFQGCNVNTGLPSDRATADARRFRDPAAFPGSILTRALHSAASVHQGLSSNGGFPRAVRVTARRAKGSRADRAFGAADFLPFFGSERRRDLNRMPSATRPTWPGSPRPPLRRDGVRFAFGLGGGPVSFRHKQSAGRCLNVSSNVLRYAKSAWGVPQEAQRGRRSSCRSRWR